MLKFLMAIFELLKKALFKHDDEYNVKSHRFDAVKVSIFLFIIGSSLFNYYALKTIASDLVIIDGTKKLIAQDLKYRDCIDTIEQEYKQRAALGPINGRELLQAIRTCSELENKK